MRACTPASGRTPGIRRPVRTITRPSICLRRIAFGLPTSPAPSGVMVAAFRPYPCSRSAVAASRTTWFRVSRRRSSERSKSSRSTLKPMTSASSSRTASSSSSSPVWSPCRTTTVDPATSLLNQAERNHHAQLVGNAPMLDHLAVLEPADIDDVDEGLLACSRAPCEGPQVGSAAALAGPHLVTDRDDILDGDLEIGERSPQVPDGAFGGFGSISADPALVLHGAVGDQLVGDLEVALVEALLDQAAVVSFVDCGGHEPLLEFIRGILG